VEQILRTSGTITHGALASNLQRAVSHSSMKCDTWLVTSCPDYSYRTSVTSICRRVRLHSLILSKRCGWYRILETYSNSAFKNTSETDIFPHGAKSLLTSDYQARWLVENRRHTVLGQWCNLLTYWSSRRRTRISFAVASGGLGNMTLWFCYLIGTGITYGQLGFEVMPLAEMSRLCRLREAMQRN